jgi:hypothetical protein
LGALRRREIGPGAAIWNRNTDIYVKRRPIRPLTDFEAQKPSTEEKAKFLRLKLAKELNLREYPRA